MANDRARADRRSLRTIDTLSAGLPSIACRGLCQRSCGPVLMTGPEWRRIVDRLGVEPEGDETLTCPMLDRATGRCTVYAIRPLICRVWGLVKSMACPFGCQPSRWLTDREARAILDKANRIGAMTEERS